MKKLFVIILFSLFILFPNNSEAAIAFDAVSSGQNSGANSITIPHTCSGDNRILFIAVGVAKSSGDADIITGVTYNGDAMTRINKSYAQANTVTVLYYLINPNSGENNIVVSLSTTTQALDAVGISYTGALQSDVPDSSAIDNSDGDLTGTTLVVGDNCWLVMSAVNNASTYILTPIDGTTKRAEPGRGAAFDSNGIVGTGNQSLGFTVPGQPSAIVIASFEPAPPTDTCTPVLDGVWPMDLQDHCTTTVSTYSDYGMECYNPVGGSWVIGANTEVRRGSSTNCLPQIEGTGVFSIQPIQ